MFFQISKYKQKYFEKVTDRLSFYESAEIINLFFYELL